MNEIRGAVLAGTSWLESAQLPDGQFASYASSLQAAPIWEPDSLNFVTALTSLALDGINSSSVAAMQARAAAYLRSQREPGGIWRYWSGNAPLHDYTPPDVDDTACCAMATGQRPAGAVLDLLLANRDSRGRFYTWMLWRPMVRSYRYRWFLRAEGTVATRSRRDELWANSEASPDDVDVTVNANVIRFLGPKRSPGAAVEWVASVIESGAEVEQDHWYRSRTSLYRSVAVSAAGGIHRFAQLRDLIVRRITCDPGPDALRNDLEVADALKVLCLLNASCEVVASFVDQLLDRQRDDGSWDRSICYFGGPQESFAWSSESLTTATALGALVCAESHGVMSRKG